MDATRALLRFAPGLLLGLLWSPHGLASAVDAVSLQAEQTAALPKLKPAADATIEAAGTSPVNWGPIEARLSDVYKPMARVAEIPNDDTLQGSLMCLKSFEAISEVYRVIEGDRAGEKIPQGSSNTKMKDLIAASPDGRRLHAQAFVEQIRCSTRMLLKDAGTWPLEGGTDYDINRMVGMQAQPFRAFTMLAMGGMMDPRTPAAERTALAAQAIPAVRDLAPALAPEMRESFIKVAQQGLNEAKLDDPSAMQSVIDAFKTDACAISCQRSKGRIGNP